MFLCHFTTPSNLIEILKDNELKSNFITGNTEEGQDIYKTPNHFVYFTVSRELFHAFDVYELFNKNKTSYKNIILYFSPKMLQQKKFYLSTVFSPKPDDLGFWREEDGTQQQKKSHARGMTEAAIEKELDKFYYFNNFVYYHGQVAIKERTTLKPYFVGIEFRNCIPSKKILALLQKQYPGVKVKITKTNHKLDMKKFQNEQKYVNNFNLKTIQDYHK